MALSSKRVNLNSPFCKPISKKLAELRFFSEKKGSEDELSATTAPTLAPLLAPTLSYQISRQIPTAKTSNLASEKILPNLCLRKTEF